MENLNIQFCRLHHTLPSCKFLMGWSTPEISSCPPSFQLSKHSPVFLGVRSQSKLGIFVPYQISCILCTKRVAVVIMAKLVMSLFRPSNKWLYPSEFRLEIVNEIAFTRHKFTSFVFAKLEEFWNKNSNFMHYFAPKGLLSSDMQRLSQSKRN